MSEISKRTAIARIVSDLIKADNIIDEKEINSLDHLEESYSIHQKDLVAAQLITFSQAVNELRERMDSVEKQAFLNQLKSIARVDGVCTVHEALLLLAVKYCLDEDKGGCSELLTCESSELIGINQHFIIYIESEEDKDIQKEIDDSMTFRSITQSVRMSGLEFIYMPYLIDEFRKKDAGYVKKVLKYMSPNFSEETIEKIYNKITSITTKSFTDDLLSKKMGLQVRNTEPALLINIGSSLVPYCNSTDNNLVYTEFLRINITGSLYDEVRYITDQIESMVNEQFYASSKISAGRMKYFGFYKALLDLMVYTRSESDLLINIYNKKSAITFFDTNEVLKLKPNEAALYILMIHQTLFDPVNQGLVYEPGAKKKQMLNSAYMEIYGRLSGSELTKDFNANIAQTVSHIRKALKEMRYLKNVCSYLPEKDEVNGVYRVPITQSMVKVAGDDDSPITPIMESEFWKRL